MDDETYRTYDLNIFWEEFYDKHLGSWLDDKLTIDVYDYETNDFSCSRQEMGVTFKCTREESLAIAEHFSENEYGSDWWVFMDEALPYFSDRIKKILAGLPEIHQTNEEETIMNETIEKVTEQKYQPVTKKSLQVFSVWEHSYVPQDAAIQVGVSTHVRGGDGSRGIVDSISFTLTTEEAVELIDALEGAIADNKRAEDERQVIRDFYESRSNVN